MRLWYKQKVQVLVNIAKLASCSSLTVVNSMTIQFNISLYQWGLPEIGDGHANHCVKKISFPLRSFLVNLTKSVENLVAFNGKLHFLCRER